MTLSRRRFFQESARLAGWAGIAGSRPENGGTERAAERGRGGTCRWQGLAPALFSASRRTSASSGPARTISSILSRGPASAGSGTRSIGRQVEKEKGAFRFPAAYDLYLKAARARGLRVLLILDFGNPLYTGSDKRAPATDAERQAFARYCREVVARYAPLGVRHYEIWNEPNASTFWRPQPNPEDYAKLLEPAYKACKEADPEATVLGCSTSGTDLDFIGRVLAAGGARSMDGVSFHPYCQPLRRNASS